MDVAQVRTDTSRDAYVFAADERQRFDLSLANIDSELERIARRYGLLVTDNAGRGWPGRTLYRRSLTKTYWLRISLEPRYVDTGSILWNVHEVWMFGIGSLYRKTISSRTIFANLSLDNADSGIGKVIEAAIGANSRT
jgi:hypothetical protein